MNKTAEVKKMELSRKEELFAEIEQEKKEFMEAYEKLCKEKGYRLDPIIELSMTSGIQGGLNVVPIR